MKDNQQDNRWLDEIRDEMQNFEAKIPVDGWERVSSSLSQPSKPVIRKRWIGVAASILFCAILGSAYFHVGDKSETNSDELVVVRNTMENEPQSVIIEESIQPLERTLSLRHRDIASARKEASKCDEIVIQKKEEIIVENSEQETTMLNPQKDNDTKNEIACSHRDTVLAMPKHEEKKVLLAMNEKDTRKMENAGWSFGLHGGGNGSFFDNEMSSGLQQMGDPTIGGYNGPNTPEEKDVVTESNKHTSWSLGLSVDRQIFPRTTLETGIVYTFLSSDVKMKYTGIKKQEIQYLGIPLRLNYMLTGNDQCQLYVGAGVMLEHSLSATRGEEHFDVKPWQWSSNLSIGGQFRVSNHIMLYIEPGVSLYHNVDHSVPSLRSVSPVYFNLRGGIRLHK